MVDGVNATPATYYVHADHLHRPIRMSNAAKSIVWSAEYQPWGAVQSLSGALTMDLRFPGQWFQLEAGLHYNWHRHYDASLGRYTQPDPLGFVDGPSVYGYAKGNPYRWVDLLGLFSYPTPWIPPTLPVPVPPLPDFTPAPQYPSGGGEWTMPPIDPPQEPGGRQCTCRCRATDRAKQQSYFAERTADSCFQATRDACQASRKHCQVGNGDVHHQEARCTDGTIRDGGGSVIGRYRYDG